MSLIVSARWQCFCWVDFALKSLLELKLCKVDLRVNCLVFFFSRTAFGYVCVMIDVLSNDFLEFFAILQQ